MANETRLPNGLTQKQFSFYNNLIEQMKKTGKMEPKKAAIEAGFSPANVSEIAYKLLKKPEGQAYLKSIQENSMHSASASIDWVMEKLTRIANLGVQEDGSFNYSALQCSLKAISEINKIKGYYAPDKKVNLNLDMDDIQEARARELTIKYTREY